MEGMGPGMGILPPSRSLRVISRSTSSGSAAWMLVAGGGQEEDARVAQRDGPVAVVGHDQPHRHHAVAEVIDAEDGLFFLCVVGFGGDGHLFVVVHLDRGKGGGRLHRRRRVVAGHGRQSQPQQEATELPAGSSSCSTVSFCRVRPLKGKSVTHDSVFLQSGVAGGPGGRRALVAVEDGHHPQVPRRAAGAAGPGPARWRIGPRTAA